MYERSEIEALLPDAMGGRSPKQYVAQAVAMLRDWCGHDAAGHAWAGFGPWWPVVQRLLVKAYPDLRSVKDWNGGNPAPEYLEHYDFGEDTAGMVLNLVAALTYLNRHGDYVVHPDYPHDITMPDGESRLYVAGLGLVERDADLQ